ncbi:MAG TPA: hypothetical protein VG870_07050 [Chitinophagaceae bacterium]|nr:hypothetical protein [Chitinophagaceae bacterium]
MTNLIKILLLAGITCLTGCLDITQDLTVNADGSGTLANTTDLSEVMNMAMQMAGDKAQEEKMHMDTVIRYRDMLDSASHISPEEKNLLAPGVLHLVMNQDSQKYYLRSSVPFRKLADVVPLIQALQKGNSGKMMGTALKELMKDRGDSTMTDTSRGEDAQPGMPDNYLIITCKPGLISRVVDKQKLAALSQDESLAKLREMGAMTGPLKTHFVIHLPRPAKKVEGKNVRLSGDRRQVTISNELDDLYDDPSSFEFQVTY